MSLSETSQPNARFSDTFFKDAVPVLPPSVEVFKLRFEIPQIQKTIDEVLLSIERVKNRLEGQPVFPEDEALLDSLVITLQVFTNDLEQKASAYFAITGREFAVSLPSAPIPETPPLPSIAPLPPMSEHLNGNGNGNHDLEPVITTDINVFDDSVEPEKDEKVVPIRKRRERIDYEALLEFVDAELYSRYSNNDLLGVPYNSLFSQFFEAAWTPIFNSRLNTLLPKLELAAQGRGLRLVLVPGKAKTPTTLRYANSEIAVTDVDEPAQKLENSENTTEELFEIDPEKDLAGAQMLSIMKKAISEVPELYSSFQEKRISKLRIERINYMLSRTKGSTKISRDIKSLGLGSEENMTLWFSPREVAILVAVGKAGLEFGSKFAEVLEKFTATLPPEDESSHSLPKLVPTQILTSKRRNRKKK